MNSDQTLKVIPLFLSTTAYNQPPNPCNFKLEYYLYLIPNIISLCIVFSSCNKIYYQKIQQLNNAIYYFVAYLVRNLGQLSPFIRVSLVMFLSEGSGEISASMQFQAVNRIQFLTVVELRSHFPAGSQSGSCFQLLKAHVPSSMALPYLKLMMGDLPHIIFLSQFESLSPGRPYPLFRSGSLKIISFS